LTELLFKELDTPAESGTRGSQSPHAFTVMARVLNDKTLNSISFESDNFFVRYLQVMKTPALANAIFQNAKEWNVDVSSEAKVAKKVEELHYLASLMFAAPAQSNGPKADFIL
jgi:hypothetical protein